MPDENTDEITQISLSGARTPASDRLLLTDHRSHPWNVTLPRPITPDPEPAVLPRYRLTVRHNSEKRTGSEEPVTSRAECDDMQALLELHMQFSAIDYHFVCLERLEP